mgnify:CR=1 FL=1
MKKIPTLFKRLYCEDGAVILTREVTEGMEWVLSRRKKEQGVATVKWDGSACAIIDGELYKRYDAKRGKQPPEGAIPCQDAPDPVTGHWPHWVKVDPEKPENRWFVEAWKNSTFDGQLPLPDGTYEAMGKHFQGNPYGSMIDWLTRHGIDEVKVRRTYEGIREFLEKNEIEGLVFWKDGEPKCKIKRTDFGFRWPVESDVKQ